MADVEGYCVKCKGKVKIKDPKEKKNARGIKIAQGKCPKCGTTVTRILGNK